MLLGSGSDHETAVEEMLAYAHDTQHEKIIRGLAMGLALIMSGREEQSDVCADTLLQDKDSNLRYGGCYMLALAYAATANNSAVRNISFGGNCFASSSIPILVPTPRCGVCFTLPFLTCL